ncbi:MAG TPA: PLP-dependent aminotransferase family protein [Burkholderiales bacterium]|nr:PLP-dependent aminotransferase family protein [Burkholderiales bacterium]
METEQNAVLYESVASDIISLIESGALATGARVPSVRRLSRQRRVSISTVVQAYRVLEARGVIEVRPQSGHYVRARPTAMREPSLSAPPRAPRLVGVHALVSKVLEAARHPDVAPLGTALPPAELIPTARLGRLLSATARRAPDTISTYGFPPGRAELRKQIAAGALDYGVRLTPDEIIITNGCIEAVNLCLRAVAKPGDVIALESPTYFGLLQIIESLGMKALEIPTHPRGGISLEALELAIDRQRVKACLFMPSVSNPLGSTMSDAAKARLVKMLDQRGVPLIEDAVYSALHFGPTQPRAAKAFDRTGNVLLCSSFTKTLAPGFRVGWVAPGRYFEQTQMLKFISSVGVSDVLQVTIAAFLENGGYDRLLRKLRKTYSNQVQLVTAAIGRYFPTGTKVTRPTGGYVVWVEMPQEVNALQLYDRAIAERISLAPGAMFSASDRYTNCIRLNCGIPWSGHTEAILRRVGTLAAACAAGEGTG